MTVLFNSSRPLGRCENLTAIWDAYDGPKRFFQGGFADVSPFAECDVVVTDEFVRAKAPHQAVVMVEHGLRMKRYGLDQPHGVYTPEACRLVDWFVSPSEQSRRWDASAAGIPVERCLPLGFPRTDAYIGKRKGDGGTFLADYDRAYLFAPTFRASWEPEAPEIDWAVIDNQMDDGEILVVKRHMLTGRSIADGEYEHIVEVDSSEPSVPYLIDCDAVMTDYSSIALDGYVFGKPCLLYCPDRAGYMESRGTYMDYPRAYSSRYLMAEYHDAIIPLLRRACCEGMRDVDLDCRDAVAGACDGHSTERVIEFIRSLT